jgi:hypothetical protein
LVEQKDGKMGPCHQKAERKNNNKQQKLILNISEHRQTLLYTLPANWSFALHNSPMWGSSTDEETDA